MITRSMSRYVTGVVSRDRLLNFETMLWRVTRGNVFVRHDSIDEKLEDPITGQQVNKVVFIVFFQGTWCDNLNAS